MESGHGELYRLEIRNRKKVFTKSRPDPSKGKGGGKGKTYREMFPLWTDWSHSSRLQSQRPRQWRTPKICAQREECWKLGTIHLGSFEVLSDHGDEVQDDEPTNETTELMPPLPPDSWLKRTETFCGKFREPCNEDHQDAEDSFLDCWVGKQEKFDALQQMGPWARDAAKSEPDVKGCLSVNFPACSVCQKLGV